MGLRINQEKTKYMITSQNAMQSENVTIGNYTFEAEQAFVYLGSPVNCNNDISKEIKKCILIADKCCYGLNKILIRPGLTYTSETCVLSTSNKKLLLSL
jgi:hypothetical protein